MDDLDLGATLKGFSPGQKVFNRYTLVRILGRGGMGVVWLARDEELEREIALKFLPEVVAMDKQSIAELKRETRRSLDLTHPHIIRIYDFVQDGRTAAISMEYVAGETLAALKADRPGHCFAPAEIEQWTRQLCEALDYAHSRAQVVHRDLKPANLMIDHRGELKIADFGIAASVSESVSRVSVQAGSSGTPVYMSPQQMMGERPSVSDDIYALGATLYDLLTGKPPFYAGNIIAQVQAKVPPALAARRVDLEAPAIEIPPPWEETVAACLAKEANGRPSGARDVADRIFRPQSSSTVPVAPIPALASQAAAPVAAAPSATASKSVDAAVVLPKRNVAIIGSAFAAAALALAVAAYYFTKDPVPSTDDTPKLVEQEKVAELPAKDSDLPKEVPDAAEEAARLAEQNRLAEEARIAAEKQAAEEQQERIAANAHALIVSQIRHLAIKADENAQREVAQSVERYLADTDTNAERREEVKSAWEEKVRAIEAARPVPQTVSLTGRSPGINYQLVDGGDGKPVRGALPASLKLVPGKYSFEFERPGYGRVRRSLEVGMQPTGLEVDLTGASLTVTSTPGGATVKLNGKAAGTTPLTLKDQPPGEVVIEIEKADFDPVRVTKTLTLGDEVREAATLTENRLLKFTREAAGHWKLAMPLVNNMFFVREGDKTVVRRDKYMYLRTWQLYEIVKVHDNGSAEIHLRENTGAQIPPDKTQILYLRMEEGVLALSSASVGRSAKMRPATEEQWDSIRNKEGK